MMFVWNHTCNPCLVKCSLGPLPTLKRGPGWTLLPTVFGVVVLSVPTSMHGSSTLMHAPSNGQQSLPASYRTHERAKVCAYEQRVREVGHGSFTPLVMSLTGGAGPACFKRLASLLSKKWDQSYSSTLAWLRCTLSSALLRSSIQCLWGACSAAGRPSRNVLLPVDLVLSEAGFDI